MKINGLILILATFFVASCSDGFLNQYPKGRWHPENMPQSAVDNSILVEGKLMQAYGDLRDWNNNWPVFAMHNYTTPEGEKGSEPADGGADLLSFKSMSFTPSNGVINGYYSICYSTIFKANEALLLINRLADSDPKKLKYKAEAQFIRAWMYYRLTQAFGGVPYIDRVLAQNEKSPARMNLDELRAKIISELDAAIPLLPTRVALNSSGNGGRATQNAARAIIAKTYLYQKKWASARSYTQQIISSGDNDLTTPFSQIFLEDKEFGPESVLEVNCEQKPDQKIYLGSLYGPMQGYRGQPNLGWGFNGPSYQLINSFEPGDPRKAATVIAPNDDLEGRKATPGSGAYGYCNRKAYAPIAEFSKYGRSEGDQANWKNIRVIRYADILLMHAEACCELGDDASITDALEKLEMVRARARGGNSALLPKITAREQSVLRTAIRNERKFELALEYERFYDLVRWGIAKDVIPGFVVGRHELYPIPQSEIDKGEGTIVQNPGY